jgi:cystathionine gamma-lyase
MGLRTSYADPNVAGSLQQAIQADTRMIWVETPSNPLLKITDLEEIARIGKARGILTVVDNTFASPFIQRPLDLGIDIVLHSVTKYISGHSDMVGGAVVVNERHDIAEKLEYMQNAIGSILDPFSSFLALRGMKTLPLRMKRHCGNAMHLAAWLNSHPKLERVIYPGLPNHAQHLLAAKQMNGFGAMISVYLKTDMNGVRRALEACKLFTLAESLGGVESLIGHPVTMSHGSLPADLRARLGISDNLVRLSVGIEDVEDLIADLDRALSLI